MMYEDECEHYSGVAEYLLYIASVMMILLTLLSGYAVYDVWFKTPELVKVESSIQENANILESTRSIDLEEEYNFRRKHND